MQICPYRGIFALAVVLFAGCAAASSVPVEKDPIPLTPVSHVYRSVDGQKLEAYVFDRRKLHQTPVPAVLLFRGGGWRTGEAKWAFCIFRPNLTASLVNLEHSERFELITDSGDVNIP